MRDLITSVCGSAPGRTRIVRPSDGRPAVAAQQRLPLISATHAGELDSPSLRGRRPNPVAGRTPPLRQRAEGRLVDLREAFAPAGSAGYSNKQNRIRPAADPARGQGVRSSSADAPMSSRRPPDDTKSSTWLTNCQRLYIRIKAESTSGRLLIRRSDITRLAVDKALRLEHGHSGG